MTKTLLYRYASCANSCALFADSAQLSRRMHAAAQHLCGTHCHHRLGGSAPKGGRARMVTSSKRHISESADTPVWGLLKLHQHQSGFSCLQVQKASQHLANSANDATLRTSCAELVGSVGQANVDAAQVVFNEQGKSSQLYHDTCKHFCQVSNLRTAQHLFLGCSGTIESSLTHLNAT